MAGIAGDLLLHADVPLAPVDAVQKGDGHAHRDIGPIVIYLRLEAAEAPKPAEAAEAAEALRLRPEDVGEMAQDLIDVGRVGLVARAALVHAGMTELVIARALLVVFENLVRLAHFNELLLGVLVALRMRESHERKPCWCRDGISWRARNSAF